MANTFVIHDTRTVVALCRHYSSAHFVEQRVPVTGYRWASTELTVTWAVGVLSNNEWEALGAWAGTAAHQAFWLGVWADLDSRGVDKISLVCVSETEASSLCPWAKVLPPFGRILSQGNVLAVSSVGLLRAEARRAVREATGVRAARIALECLLAKSRSDKAAVLSADWPEVLEQLRPFYALRPHRRAVVRAGDEHLEQLGHGLHRAVARHGPFADLAAAVSFVAQTISRDELRLKFPKLSTAARPRLRLVGSDAAGAASLGH